MRRWSNLLTLALAVLLLPAAPPEPAAAAGGDPSWLSATNTVRSLGRLEHVDPNRQWSKGARQHARYMARHGELTHQQSPGRAGATRAGAAAARSSNIAYGHPTQQRVVLGWLASPKHAYWLLNPAARRFGFGHARASDGTNWWALRVFGSGSVNVGVPRRGGRLWPAEGAAVPAFQTRTTGLSGCGGGSTGVAAYWRSRKAPRTAVMWVNGRRVPSCVAKVQDGFYAVVARRPTRAGSRVQVQLVGKGMPSRRRFRVVGGLGRASVGGRRIG